VLKLRSILEDVAEKWLGRFLPQVEALAHAGCHTTHLGCCGSGFAEWAYAVTCYADANHTQVESHTYYCDTICPT
jgi:hypothetical protein